MLLLFENKIMKQKKIHTIVSKIPLINKLLSKNKESKENKSVEQFVELKNIHATPNSVISEIVKIFSLENDTFVSTKLQNENQLYNSFLEFCWNNRNSNDSLPDAKIVQKILEIEKQERLKLQARAINEKILEKKGNNKVFFSKNFNDIEEVLE